jgi:putative endonuclease
MSAQFFVYIMTNKNNTVLYAGMTNNLVKRVYQHKKKLVRGFTQKYNVTRLVFFEAFDDPRSAITREKQIKAGSRLKKTRLISKMNPRWEDLYDKL